MKKLKNNKNKNKKDNSWKWFDDCAICQAMKNSEVNNFDSLMKAFDEQNLVNKHMTMRVQNKDDFYYDAMDACSAGDFELAQKLLLKARDLDPNYVQTYVGLVSAYSRKKDNDKREECIRIAFEKTKEIFPKWPKRMEWGFLENRAYLRAIEYRAAMYWDHGDLEKAEELFRLLLTLNPNDNQGVRYEISAMFAGINGPELNKMFDEGNLKQNWSKLGELVSSQNKKYKFWKGPKY